MWCYWKSACWFCNMVRTLSILLIQIISYKGVLHIDDSTLWSDKCILWIYIASHQCTTSVYFCIIMYITYTWMCTFYTHTENWRSIIRHNTYRCNNNYIYIYVIHTSHVQNSRQVCLIHDECSRWWMAMLWWSLRGFKRFLVKEKRVSALLPVVILVGALEPLWIQVPS